MLAQFDNKYMYRLARMQIASMPRRLFLGSIRRRTASGGRTWIRPFLNTSSAAAVGMDAAERGRGDDAACIDGVVSWAHRSQLGASDAVAEQLIASPRCQNMASQRALRIVALRRARPRRNALPSIFSSRWPRTHAIPGPYRVTGLRFTHRELNICSQMLGARPRSWVTGPWITRESDLAFWFRLPKQRSSSRKQLFSRKKRNLRETTTRDLVEMRLLHANRSERETRRRRKCVANDEKKKIYSSRFIC